jgi:diacylglycerol kinase (ATP)
MPALILKAATVKYFHIPDMKRFWTAFLNTCNGLRWGFRNETAVMQELVALALALPLAFLVSDSGYVRIALIGSVMLLVIVELLNTAIEKLCDHLSPALSAQIKVVKDLGSAAVFGALVLAAATWLVAVSRLL